MKGKPIHMMSAVLDDLRDLWAIYALMPIVAAFIGYVTKLAGLPPTPWHPDGTGTLVE